MGAVRVVIHGRVQGVWFRGWTVDQARARGLDGWVRNCHDGTVEALFAGDDTAIEEMVAACRVGPPAARVVEVERHPAVPPAEPGFRQVASA